MPLLPEINRRPIVFLYPGQGSSPQGILQELTQNAIDLRTHPSGFL